MENLPGDGFHESSEQRLANTHGSTLKKNQKTARTASRRSNQKYYSLLEILILHWLSTINPFI